MAIFHRNPSKSISRWWFQFFLFSPRTLGKWNLTKNFWMGWFHHQPIYVSHELKKPLTSHHMFHYSGCLIRMDLYNYDYGYNSWFTQNLGHSYNVETGLCPQRLEPPRPTQGSSSTRSCHGRCDLVGSQVGVFGGWLLCWLCWWVFSWGI